ncbi:protein abrupt isoform X2 [Onthophagus taurus]|uniref:protein abrupt isoform X2 n=1 Tax=Onthophagus taurus TaxID=166361 RepID=UPI000C20CFA4|nr:protein abrupt isoform X2 [Onthophagus taurus]
MGGDTSPEQQYALRWNDYPTSMISSFRHLRDEEDFVDVTLACDGCSFTAHKVVLSACSPYFKQLLKENPCQHPIIILRDVKQRDMDNLLRFMYNGEVHVGEDHLEEFIKACQMLQIRGLSELENKYKSQPVEQRSSQRPPRPLLTWANDRPEATKESDLTVPPAKRVRRTDTEDLEESSERADTPRGNNGDTQESLLGQALEGGPTIHTTKTEEDGNQSENEESNDTQTSDQERDTKTEMGDYSVMEEHPFSTNGGGLIDPARPPAFPGSLLNLQGIPGVLPGPSLLGSPDTFGARRGMDVMRVRATDPRPCPKCGKIYRSAHTLRTHLEDKHTVCPGYRCVLCGTVAKSRNSLHSHMSRQHRGISTKDLPVLPMPAPFDPNLASQLLLKAGIKVSPSELRARASPTGPRRADVKLDAKSAYSTAPSEAGSSICDDNDPEDLTMSHGRYSNDYGLPQSMNHLNSPLKLAKSMSSSQALSAKSIDSPHNLSKEPSYPGSLGPLVGNNSMGSSLLDTYLQFMTDNGFGMSGISQEQAMAALHAAKLAQINASKNHQFLEKMQQSSMGGDMFMKRNDEIRRGEGDLVINEDHERDMKEEAESSGDEQDEYSDEEREAETVKVGD